MHSHTNYCDGSMTAEEMVLAALEKGCGSIGFSEHSHLTFDWYYSMTPVETRKYADEVNALKKKYEGQIEIFLGLERDYFSDIEPNIDFDFVIGSAHYVNTEVCVDNGEINQRRMVDESFAGDYYAFIEGYFELISGIAGKTNADIIGHFDLVTKYNCCGSLFDEAHPRYVNASLGAMEEILKSCKLFEVNTGAMYRIGRPEPYPSAFLLRELQKRGGEVILSSDSHDGESICYNFHDMRELLKSCGFKYIKRLTKTGFTDERL